jgi:predicted amino acid racemase
LFIAFVRGVLTELVCWVLLGSVVPMSPTQEELVSTRDQLVISGKEVAKVTAAKTEATRRLDLINSRQVTTGSADFHYHHTATALPTVAFPSSLLFCGSQLKGAALDFVC